MFSIPRFTCGLLLASLLALAPSPVLSQEPLPDDIRADFDARAGFIQEQLLLIKDLETRRDAEDIELMSIEP